MSKKDNKTESSNLKNSNAEQILIEALKTSNKATNDRIDNLYESMVSLVIEVKTLVEAGIRREESDAGRTEREKRLEKNQIDQGKEFKEYRIENDKHNAELSKQVLLLRADYDHSKKEREKDETNSDARKNNIISTLAVLAILATFTAVYPYIVK